MGWFNAHVEETFSKSFASWVRFFLSVVARQQPLLLFTWLWSALAALLVTLTEAARPARRDALSLEVRLEAVAERARAIPGMVMALRELRAHPATARSWTLAKELWLDRVLLLLLVVVGRFQNIARLHLLAGISPAWVSLAFGLLLVPFFADSAMVRSDKAEVRRLIDTHLERFCAIARVERVVMGHAHKATQTLAPGRPASTRATGHRASMTSRVRSPTVCTALSGCVPAMWASAARSSAAGWTPARSAWAPTDKGLTLAQTRPRRSGSRWPEAAAASGPPPPPARHRRHHQQRLVAHPHRVCPTETAANVAWDGLCVERGCSPTPRVTPRRWVWLLAWLSRPSPAQQAQEQRPDVPLLLQLSAASSGGRTPTRRSPPSRCS